jgi:hypothetical protein
MDSNFLNPVSALLGALAGAGASLMAAVYTQRCQDRHHNAASEVSKRETIYADFVMGASNMLLKAYTQQEVALSGDEQRLMGLINRMRLFAAPEIVLAAEETLIAIVVIALKPGIELRQLANQALARNLDLDPLLAFTSICRTDLDRMRRTKV